MKSYQRRELAPRVSRTVAGGNKLTGSRVETHRGRMMECDLPVASSIHTVNRRYQPRLYGLYDKSTNFNHDREGSAIDETAYCAISNETNITQKLQTSTATTITTATYISNNNNQISSIQQRSTNSASADTSARRATLTKLTTTQRRQRQRKRQSALPLIASLASLVLLLAPCILITQTQAFFLSSLLSSPSAQTSGVSATVENADQSPSVSVGAPTSGSSSAIAALAPSSQSSAPSPVAAAAAAAISSLSSSLLSAATGSQQDSKRDSGNDSKPSLSATISSADSAASPGSSGSSASSVVASLSSAVASAAAAAAVAAAQSSLSGNDGRSLFSQTLKNQNHNINHKVSHALAMKLADAVPEVPYNILHNMKKVDHAAPFYNSPNKLSGSGKESGHQQHNSLLSSSNLNSAAEQLGSLFKSPLWKRISDGYGEFASEFRSLFKHTKPTTMKGPHTSSTTSKLIRDISVPALLMLIASAMPSDWRPIRMRRKSILANDLRQTLLMPGDPMSASSSDMIPTYSIAPPMFAATGNGLNLLSGGGQSQQQGTSLLARALNPVAQLYGQLDQQQQQQLGSANPLARASDINLQPATATAAMDMQQASVSNWIQPNSAASAVLMQNPSQPAQQLQTVRRSGDILTVASDSSSPLSGEQVADKLVDTLNLSAQNDQLKQQQQQQSGRSSSFTSRLINQVVGVSGASGNGFARLMGKLTNANGDNDNLQQSSYRMASLMADEPEWSVPFFTKITKRSHEHDKHRYSLLDSADDNTDSQSSPASNSRQQMTTSRRQVAGSGGAVAKHRTGPISTVTQALGSLFGAESGSLPTSGQPVGLVSSSGKKPSNSVNSMLSHSGANGDSSHSIGNGKMINHHHHYHNQDSLLRRQQSTGSGSTDYQMEQRDLSQLIPQSWREVVKRTVNNVQQTASTQWRSIEGQLTNWVQDKFKAIPSSQSSAGSSSSSTGVSPAGVSSILTAMSSNAVTRILGLGGGANASKIAPAATTESTNQSSTDGNSPSSSGNSNSATKSKTDSPSRSSKQPGAKGALAGVANMIVNTFTNRQSTSSTKAKPTTSLNDSQSSSPGSGANQQQKDPDQSMASGTSTTVAAMSLLGA